MQKNEVLLRNVCSTQHTQYKYSPVYMAAFLCVCRRALLSYRERMCVRGGNILPYVCVCVFSASPPKGERGGTS